jgi:hypothetical protein
MNEMTQPTAAELEPELIEIERCELCGCAIEDLEELIHLRAADLITQWELADPRDAWRHTGEAPPPEHIRNSDIGARPAPASRPYATAQSTVDAFFYVARNHDDAYLAAWLERHPADEAFLLSLWEAKNGKS